MTRFLSVIAAASALLLSACAGSKVPTTQAIVDESRATVEALKTQPHTPKFTDMLRDAKGVAIFPNLYKGAFFFGAEGGNGVVLVRDAGGNWSYPAFYSVAAGSFGLQFGGQRARSVVILRSDKAVKAIVEHQAKFGADVGVAVATVGTGLEGATTTNVGADIIAFNDAMGLYGGVSLEGSGLVRRNDFNQDYYGRPSDYNDILFNRTRSAAKADALRESLSR
jgi:lipid-binding SYLF domain-containing protein